MNKVSLRFICAVSAMGGQLFGYDWVMIGGAKPRLSGPLVNNKR